MTEIDLISKVEGPQDRSEREWYAERFRLRCHPIAPTAAVDRGLLVLGQVHKSPVLTRKKEKKQRPLRLLRLSRPPTSQG